jgi:hypothetical protein
MQRGRPVKRRLKVKEIKSSSQEEAALRNLIEQIRERIRT